MLAENNKLFLWRPLLLLSEVVKRCGFIVIYSREQWFAAWFLSLRHISRKIITYKSHTLSRSLWVTIARHPVTMRSSQSPSSRLPHHRPLRVDWVTEIKRWKILWPRGHGTDSRDPQILVPSQLQLCCVFLPSFCIGEAWEMITTISFLSRALRKESLYKW